MLSYDNENITKANRAVNMYNGPCYARNIRKQTCYQYEAQKVQNLKIYIFSRRTAVEFKKSADIFNESHHQHLFIQKTSFCLIVLTSDHQTFYSLFKGVSIMT